MARAVRLLLLLVPVAGILAWGWQASRPRPLTVRVAALEPGLVEQRVANTRAGTLKPCRRARLAPSLGGQIAHLGVREGQRVAAGALLLELWNQDLLARVTLAEREAEAAAASAEARCLQAAAARREARRQTRLRARGGVSEEAQDKAVSEAAAQEADCAAAQVTAQVKQAQIGVARAELTRTRLTAPFAGVVAEINGELHEYVTPSPPGIPTPPAVDLIDDSCFYVSAPIDEVDGPALRLDQPARVSLDAFGERRFPGRVRRIAPYVQDLEKQARTLEVEVELQTPDSDLLWLAGYSADVEIITDQRDGVPRLPTEALMEDNQVYVLGADGRLTRRKLRIGLHNWDWSEVLEGLRAGQRVVTSLAQEGLGEGVAAVPAAPVP